MKSREMSDRRWNWSRMHPCWMSSSIIIIIMDVIIIIIMVVYHRIIIDRRHHDMEEEVEGVMVDLLVTRVAVGTVDAVDDVVLAITSRPTLARCNWT